MLMRLHGNVAGWETEVGYGCNPHEAFRHGL